ncbi:hypothetical protein CSC43_4120 [Pseudomonas aeruginosa]|nr:hypothetical protein CSC43_4120 [Pseudomonas aeruginosa]
MLLDFPGQDDVIPRWIMTQKKFCIVAHLLWQGVISRKSDEEVTR